MTGIIEASLLYKPDSASLRFLPEGPMPCSDGRVSWVSIQHGVNESVGSLNLLDLASGENENIPLPGRPGFAFEIEAGQFLIGLARHLGRFDIDSREWTPISPEVDADREGTIINDGVLFEHGVVFGTKELTFSRPDASLYLWRFSDEKLIRLADGQTCSNGKILESASDNKWTLYDIDSPTKTMVQYSLDVETGELSAPDIVLDFRDGDIFPDGMDIIPGGESVVIAFYNPNDAAYGVARQFRLRDGELEREWQTPGSPRVTCPLVIPTETGMQLILTTADEGMTPEQQTAHPNAGCLFVA